MLIKDALGGWFVGDSHPPRSRLTPISEYVRMVESGEIELRVMIPEGWDENKGFSAGWWWQDHVVDRVYDYFAFPYLAWRCLVEWLRIELAKAGVEWAWYCTEGVRDAYKFVGLDPYKKKNPTPFTTEKRVGSSLIEITEKVVSVLH